MTLDEILSYYAGRNTSPISDTRKASLTMAVGAGASDQILTTLADARLLARRDMIVLPSHRYESLSRGRGWARRGQGDAAQWGERDDNGYRVGPGRWTVGATDGFSRKGQDVWTVTHINVGSSVWTVAE